MPSKPSVNPDNTCLDWQVYENAGMGDAYADIPRTGGNFAKAVSVCINSRQCEHENAQHQKGVMCPSYRVTQDSHLSPGGRVRLLKAALNGELGERPFQGNAALAASMALCVGCKGCKRECENGVDMAMIKVEYLAQRYTRRHVPLRARLLANLSRQLHRHPVIKHLPRLRNRMPMLARITESLLGLSARRQLPEPVDRPFTQRGGIKTTPPVGHFHSEVVLLIDTFTNNFAPANAEAAIAVLERAGYRVIPARTNHNTAEAERPLCCGRTHIANGLLDQARVEAGRMLSVLLPHVEAGRQIIGLEPVCLLAIRDDYLFLGLGEAAAKVSRQAILFEEFIVREQAANRFKLAFKAVDTHGQPLLVHGHCHQKAVGAMKSMRKLLKAIPGLDFTLIEASCCGMAGSFGIEREHAELSMQMAELSLLPAVREQPQARVLANGFSCRHQIEEGAGRASIHLATLLREALP